jgi:hypothetical protein
MAATLVGRRASNAVSKGRCWVPWILMPEVAMPATHRFHQGLRGKPQDVPHDEKLAFVVNFPSAFQICKDSVVRFLTDL